MKRILMSLSLAVLLGSVAAVAQVNVAGQDGDRVWGYGGAKDFWFRGHWDGPRPGPTVHIYRLSTR